MVEQCQYSAGALCIKKLSYCTCLSGKLSPVYESIRILSPVSMQHYDIFLTSVLSGFDSNKEEKGNGKEEGECIGETLCLLLKMKRDPLSTIPSAFLTLWRIIANVIKVCELRAA